MADEDRVTNAMATLMPVIRKAFTEGAEKPKLSTVLRVEQRESALNVRLRDPLWPTPSDDLEPPGGAPETALRLCRAMPLKPVGADAEWVKDQAKSFGEATAAAYVRAVLAKLVSAVSTPDTATPDLAALRAKAKALGPPCRVVAGSNVYRLVKKDLPGDGSVDSVVEAPAWPDNQTLVLSLTSTGPWVEELEPAFVIEWDPPDANRNVKILAARRLYLHQTNASYLYRP